MDTVEHEVEVAERALTAREKEYEEAVKRAHSIKEVGPEFEEALNAMDRALAAKRKAFDEFAEARYRLRCSKRRKK